MFTPVRRDAAVFGHMALDARVGVGVQQSIVVQLLVDFLVVFGTVVGRTCGHAVEIDFE